MPSLRKARTSLRALTFNCGIRDERYGKLPRLGKTGNFLRAKKEDRDSGRRCPVEDLVDIANRLDQKLTKLTGELVAPPMETKNSLRKKEWSGRADLNR